MVETIKHDRPLISCRVDPSGQYVFAGAQDNNLHRWDLFTGSHVAMKGHKSWIRRFRIAPDGNLLVTGGYDGRLIWWNAFDSDPAPLRTIDAHHGFVRGVAISPDGQWIATGGNDNLVKIWSAADGQLVQELPGHERFVYNVLFHPSGKYLVSGDLMGVLKQWEVGTWKHVRDFDGSPLSKYDKTFRADCGGIRGMDFSSDGKLLAAAGITDVSNAFAGVGVPAVALFDWESGKRTHLMKPEKNFRGACWGVKFHPSGKFLVGAGGGSGGSLWFWKPNEDKSFFDFKLPGVGYDVDFHPDGLRIAVAVYDKTLRIYDLSPKLEVAAKK